MFLILSHGFGATSSLRVSMENSEMGVEWTILTAYIYKPVERRLCVKYTYVVLQ